MEKKQTAVQWLEEQLYKTDWDKLNHDERMNLFSTAKFMEMDHILKSHVQGQWAILNKKGGIGATEYYNEISGAKSEWVKISE